MGEIKGYIGSAGTGKTTRLIAELSPLIKTLQNTKFQSVLALTFMHGSRKRLHDKLSFLKKEKVVYKCQTIDSFATHMVERFRRFLNIKKSITVLPGETIEDIREDERCCYVSWNYIRKSFIELLKFKVIRDFISASYPVIIIDEFQDCENDLLEITKALTQCDSSVLIAGDNFQQLNESETCAATNWLKTICTPEELLDVHRTKETAILASAIGLRNNTPVQNSLTVKVASSPQLAAWQIASMIQWHSWGRRGKNLVVLYPVSPEKSLFIKEALKRLHEPFPKHSFDPHPFKFENKQLQSGEEILIALFEKYSPCSISYSLLKEWVLKEDVMMKTVSLRALKLLSLRGDEEITKTEFEILLNKENYLHRSFYNTSEKINQVAMTIHAAKNREFDYVIILWPYEVPKGDIYRRKLLYNAITRARHNVILIVQAKNEASFKKDKILTLFDKVEFSKDKKKKINGKSPE